MCGVSLSSFPSISDYIDTIHMWWCDDQSRLQQSLMFFKQNLDFFQRDVAKFSQGLGLFSLFMGQIFTLSAPFLYTFFTFSPIL